MSPFLVDSSVDSFRLTGRFSCSPAAAPPQRSADVWRQDTYEVLTRLFGGCPCRCPQAG